MFLCAVLPVCIYAGDDDKIITDPEALKKWVKSWLKFANVNNLNSDGHSQLHRAAGEGGVFDIERVRTLINRGADVNILDTMGRNPLHAAARVGHWNSERAEIINLLVNKGTNVNLLARDFDHLDDREGGTPLYEAAYGDHPEAIRTLVRLGARLDVVTRQGNTPLHIAARSESLQAIITLVDLGLHLNSRNNCGDTPLHTAAFYDCAPSIVTLTYLLWRSALDSESPVAPSVENALTEHADRFSCTFPDDLHNQYLIAQFIPMIESLLRTQTSYAQHFTDYVNAVNNYGDSPLHVAAWSQSFKAIRILVQLGARLDLLDNSGRTPLELFEVSLKDEIMLDQEQIKEMRQLLAGHAQESQIENDSNIIEINYPGEEAAHPNDNIIIIESTNELQNASQTQREDTTNIFDSAEPHTELTEADIKAIYQLLGEEWTNFVGGIAQERQTENNGNIIEINYSAEEAANPNENIIIIESTNGPGNATQLEEIVLDECLPEQSLAEHERNERMAEIEGPRTTYFILNEELEIEGDSQESRNLTIEERLLGKRGRNLNPAEYRDHSGL